MPWGWTIHDFIEVVTMIKDGDKVISEVYGLLGHYVIRFDRNDGNAPIYLHELRCGVW